MRYDEQNRSRNLLTGFALGALAGAGAVLLATSDLRLRHPPTAGERLTGWSEQARDRLLEVAGEWIDAAVRGTRARLPG
ncbi:MAG: hypothetical protein ACREKN_08160 [Longimicrobiaceae bacterium]